MTASKCSPSCPQWLEAAPLVQHCTVSSPNHNTGGACLTRAALAYVKHI